MTNKKIIAGTIATAMFLSLAGSLVFAKENENSNHNNEDKVQMAGTAREVQISGNGKILIRGAQVTAKSGSQFTLETKWGSTSITWIVKTDSSTNFVRKFGGHSTIDEITNGDVISVNGTLDMTTSSPTIMAKTVKDWSIQESETLTGTVVSVNTTAKNSFVFHAGDRDVTANFMSTTQIYKDGVLTNYDSLTVGATVKVKGVLNLTTNTIMATRVEIKSPVTTQPQAKTIEGKLVKLQTTATPNEIAVHVGDTDYIIKLSASTAVLNRLWLPALLTDFQLGDNVRAYGLVETREGKLVVTATVVRNTSLPR